MSKVKPFFQSYSYVRKLSVHLLRGKLFGMLFLALSSVFRYLFIPVLIYSVLNAIETYSFTKFLILFSFNFFIFVLYLIACYVNNVHLDMYNFKINYATRIYQINACHLSPERDIEETLESGEIYNRIDQSSYAHVEILSSFGIIITNTILVIIMLLFSFFISSYLLYLILAGGVFFIVLSFLSEYITKKAEVIKQKKLAEQEMTTRRLAAANELRCFGPNVFDEQHEIFENTRRSRWNQMMVQELTLCVFEVLIESFITVIKGAILFLLYPGYAIGTITYAIIAGLITTVDSISGLLIDLPQPLKSIVSSMLILKKQYLMSEEKQECLETCNEIELKDYSYISEEKEILSYINLKFSTDEKIAIVGQNGSGKTTLIKAILGRLSHSGNIYYNGKKKRLTHKYKRANFSYISNRAQLFSTSIYENVLMNCEEEEKLISNYFEVLSVTDYISESTLELSSGQKQRINILRGVNHQDRCLVADEPDANLPRELGEKVIELILESSKGCFVITHNFDLLGYFDRIIYLDAGKISFDGTYELFKQHVKKV